MARPNPAHGQVAAPTYSSTPTAVGVGGGLPAHDFVRDDPSMSLVFLTENVSRTAGVGGKNTLDIFNANENLQLAQVPLAGGAHDVIPVDSLGVAFVSEGRGNLPTGETVIQIINLNNFNASNPIDVTAAGSSASIADLMGYDPRDQLLAVGLKGTTHGEVIFLKVNATGASIASTLVMPDVNATTADSPEGILWDGTTSAFYVAGENSNAILQLVIPAGTTLAATLGSSATAPLGSATSNPFTKKFANACAVVTGSKLFTTPIPHGIAMGPNGNMAIGCDGSGAVLNVNSGTVTRRFTVVQGTDQPWFDSRTNRFFFAGYSSTNANGVWIFDASSSSTTPVQTVFTGAPAFNANDIVNIQATVDLDTSKIFMPVDASPRNTLCAVGCMAVFSPAPAAVATVRATTPAACTPTTTFSSTTGFQNVFVTSCAEGQTTILTSPTNNVTCGSTNVSFVSVSAATTNCLANTGLASNNPCANPPIFVVTNPVAAQAFPATTVGFTTVNAGISTCTQPQQFP